MKPKQQARRHLSNADERAKQSRRARVSTVQELWSKPAGSLAEHEASKRSKKEVKHASREPNQSERVHRGREKYPGSPKRPRLRFRKIAKARAGVSDGPVARRAEKAHKVRAFRARLPKRRRFRHERRGRCRKPFNEAKGQHRWGLHPCRRAGLGNQLEGQLAKAAQSNRGT